jgi:hypothetical protein
MSYMQTLDWTKERHSGHMTQLNVSLECTDRGVVTKSTFREMTLICPFLWTMQNISNYETVDFHMRVLPETFVAGSNDGIDAEDNKIILVLT